MRCSFFKYISQIWRNERLKYSLQQPECQNSWTGWDHTGLFDDNQELLKRSGLHWERLEGNRADLQLIFTLKLRWSKPVKAPWVRAQSRLQTVFILLVNLVGEGAAGNCLLQTRRVSEAAADMWESMLRRSFTEQIQTQANCVLANRIVSCWPLHRVWMSKRISALFHMWRN